MKQREILQIIAAIIVLTIIIRFEDFINLEFINVGTGILFSFIIIAINILGKKVMASYLDADIEHEIWKWQRYNVRPQDHLKKSVPAGVIFPAFLSVFSLGVIKLMTLLTYETKALKRRAARRHGRYSFKEITDFHTSLIGAAGIVAVLILSFISYFIPLISPLAKFSAYYAFSNMIPFSKLDGTQIFFGSRVLWATLAVITLIFTAYALLLV